MKLGPLPILSFGFLVFMVAAGYGWFYLWQPNMESSTKYFEAAAKWEAEANKLNKAVARRKLAQEMVQERASAWQKIVDAKTPPASVGGGGIDMSVSPYQLTVDSIPFRNSVQRAINQQVRVGGVKVINGGAAVASPSEDASTIVANYYNFPAIPFPVVMHDLGTITVQGTWTQIKRNVEAWSEMPRYLAVASNLTVTGTAPTLTATYNVTIVGYLRGNKIYPGVPSTGASGVDVGGGSGGGSGGGTTPAPGGGGSPNLPFQRRSGGPRGAG